MSTSPVTFIGGPADGKDLIVAGDPPPLAMQILVEPYAPWYSDALDDEPLHQRVALYERRVNMDPSGSRWLYDFVSTS